jgi:hypothetical protein
MKEFARALLTAQEEALTCADCEMTLADYVDAEVAGDQAATLFPDIARHLQRCPYCARTAHDLRALVLLASDATLPQPRTVPQFDLSFITREPVVTPAPLAVQWQRLTDSVSRLIGAIQIQLGQTVASFTALPTGLTPTLAPALAQRGAASSDPTFVEAVAVPDEAENRLVRISLAPVQAGRGALLLEVNTLTPPAPISRAQVTLNDGNGDLLESVATQPDGTVVFRELDPGAYQIQVLYEGKLGEIAINVSAA